jgi:Domain of unknown function DUF1828
MNYTALLSEGFNKHVSVREKRPGLMKLIVPLFHEDGDMVDIFLEDLPNGQIRVSDRGLALMRLSYSFDIDTENKDRIFRRILNENHVEEEQGNLFLDVTPDHLYPAVLHFGQTVAKVSNMGLYRREVISNLFQEMLYDKISHFLSDFPFKENLAPYPERDDLIVDFALQTPKTPIYLFGVKEKDTAKLRLAALSCLEFQKLQLPFRSVVVHQDFDSFSQKDRKIITNAVDKQFTSLDVFEATGKDALYRLAA